MDLALLKAELTNDPLNVGYASLSDADVAVSLMAEARTSQAISLSRDDLLNKIIVWSEVEALTAAKRETFGLLLRADKFDFSSAGSNARTYLASLFGNGTATRTEFAKLAAPKISRANELKLGVVSAENVGVARRGG